MPIRLPPSAIRLGGLTPAERRVLMDAAMLTPVAALAVRAFRVDRALRFVTAIPLLPIRAESVPPDRIAAMVSAAASRLGARCLTQALVLLALLRQLDVEAELVIGAARGDGEFRAHAWVRQGGHVLIGDGLLDEYAPLCSFPARGSR